MPEKIVKVKDRKTNAIIETESIPMKKWLGSIEIRREKTR